LLKEAGPATGKPGKSLYPAIFALFFLFCRNFQIRGENADDLFQVGCIGLIKAIDNFDINMKVRFSTYGVPMIIGEIRRYLRTTAR
jgi:RNA polymerase sporulation-specific sigma factor